MIDHQLVAAVQELAAIMRGIELNLDARLALEALERTTPADPDVKLALQATLDEWAQSLVHEGEIQ